VTIKCPKCQAENAETKQFCGDCGTQLPSSRDIHPEVTETLQTPIKELATGATFAGRYQVIEELGKGGMGRVYKVFDTDIKEKVALKMLKPEIASDKETIERFSNELKYARKISHRNVCRMYDLGKAEGTHFITMEYVHGEDLKSMIRMSTGLTIGTVLSIGKQVCEGLAEAHGLGVVHRDLKPQNIMIDKGGNAKIMDFGIARSIREKGITGPSVLIGTPEYMSPEQAEAKEVDQRSDIYSLGIILYEMATGRAPFEGETALSIAMKHKGEIPKDPKQFNPNIPDDLSGVILKCLEKDKAKRYQTAVEIRTDLERIEKGIPTTERVVPERKTLTSREIIVKFSLKKLLIPTLVIVFIAIAAVAIRQIFPKKEVSLTTLAKKSIAVLPFVDLSPAKDHEQLCEGIAETLINALTNIEGLWVPARTSAFFFKSKERDIPEIGRKLNVENVLEGSVQVAGDNLRVTARISSVKDSRQLWSDIFNRKISDIFTIQDEIALAVVDKLKLTLLGEQKSKLIKHGTSDANAFETYLKGKYYRYEERPKSMLMARDYFEEAIRKDPNYAAAFAGLAENYMVLGVFSVIPKDEAAADALKAAQKALELDENLSEAYVSMGVIKMVFDWDWKGAEAELKKAISLNPNNFDAYREYGLLLHRTYRYDEAENALIHCQKIDPLNALSLRDLRIFYICTGQKDKAENIKKQLKEIRPDWAEFPEKSYYSVEKAKMDIQVQGRNPGFITNLAIAYIKSGNSKEASKLIEELKSVYEEGHEGNVASGLASIFDELGEKEETLAWLERAVEKKAPGLVGLSMCYLFKSLQEEPRFQALLKRVGLK
jgi:serine/threonine protein kinase/Tfp pilus assembly protein PilF